MRRRHRDPCSPQRPTWRMRSPLFPVVVLLLATVIGLTAGCATLSWPRREKAVIQRILASSVQVVLERQGSRFRTASGVVIGVRPGPGGTECLVLTSGHTFGGLRDTEPGDVYVLMELHQGAGTRAPARLLASRETEAVDLALLGTRGLRCPAVPLGAPPALGDRIWIVGFPWGRQLRLIGGIVSQVALDDQGRPEAGATLMVDASVAYGMSGAGVFDAARGRLVGLIQGYGTARVPFGEKAALQYIDVPVPGETYVTSPGTIERFLQEMGQGRGDGARP